MPAQRLDPHQSVSIQRYDVGGQDSVTEPEFVRHVGLCGEKRNNVRAEQAAVPLVHMGPPLLRDEKETFVQTVGSAELTVDQAKQVQLFVDELESEYEAQQLRSAKQYVIHPHVREPDDVVPCRRFSCAGFVIEAYRDAGINLLATDPDDLPAVGMDTLARAYPDSASHLENARLRAVFGLNGDGPWPVVLAGYVINAFDCEVREIRSAPYLPQPGDEYFPSKRISPAYEQQLDHKPSFAMDEGDRFFQQESAVFKTMRNLTSRLDELGIRYAVAGAVAMFYHGFRRFTENLNLIVTHDNLKTIHGQLVGQGYLSIRQGGMQFRDVEHGVRVELLVTGGYPGDGQPKPVSFPDPDESAVERGGIKVLSLPRLVELKLASGMTGGVTRLKDFADVVALIQTLDLPAEFAEQLDPYVREKFTELWDGVRNAPPPPDKD